MKEIKKEKLNICMAMDAYIPYVDGVVNCMDNYLKEIVKKENAFALAPKYKNQKDGEISYEILRCKSCYFPIVGAMYGFPGFDRRFKKAVKGKEIDIMHFHSPFNMSKFAVREAKRRGVPVVATFHSNFRPIVYKVAKMRFLTEWVVKYIGRVYNRVDELFCVNEGVAMQARSFGYKGKITLLPFGTELEKVTNLDCLIKRANEEFKIEENELVFLYVGRIMALKRIDFILDALKIVKEKGVDFKFFVVGKGPEERALKEKVKKLGLENSVIFTGFLDRELLPLIYARADLFLFPSLYDNFGLVKVEASTYDTPGVFIENSQAGLSVTDGVNGYLSKDTVVDFASKILYAVSDKEKLKKVGKKAGEDLYINWETCARLLVKRYKEIIENKEPNIHSISKEESKKVKQYINEEYKKFKNK
ncbi:MAG: glycosyltransferase family 4 protein [Clostridiales bacterium]|nr:glycosyltransferase family 4 protein [Clostridiales bacterium]